MLRCRIGEIEPRWRWKTPNQRREVTGLTNLNRGHEAPESIGAHVASCEGSRTPALRPGSFRRLATRQATASRGQVSHTFAPALKSERRIATLAAMHNVPSRATCGSERADPRREIFHRETIRRGAKADPRDAKSGDVTGRGKITAHHDIDRQWHLTAETFDKRRV